MKIINSCSPVESAIKEVLKPSDYILVSNSTMKKEILNKVTKDYPRRIINVILVSELKNLNKTKDIKRLIILDEKDLIESLLQKYSLNYAIKLSSIVTNEV